jgi:transcription antitermination factor NusG
LDQRDSQTWVAVELSKLGEEKVQEGQLDAVLRADLGVGDEFQIFIPAATYPRGHRKVTLLLIEGYVFLASGLPETKYFELEKRPYVSQVMSTPAGGTRIRTLTTIPNKTVEDFRNQLRRLMTADLPFGTRVKVTDGVYKNLEGVVRGGDEENAYVEIRLRSIELMATIPRVLLDAQAPVESDTDSV